VTSKRRKPAELALRRLNDDADGDSRLTDAARKLYQKIIASYNWSFGYAECSDSFVTKNVAVSLRSVKRARKLLLETERVSISRKGGKRGTVVWSTRYDLPFGYRGSDEFRELNGGRHALDWLKTPVTIPFDRPLRKVPKVPNSQSAEFPKCQISQSATMAPKPISKEIVDTAPYGAAGLSPAAVGAEDKKSKSGLPPGYAVWRIVRAGYVKRKRKPGVTYLEVNLVNERGSKFNFLADCEFESAGSFAEATNMEGEPKTVAGLEVAMSTNRKGPKSFVRPRPEPWRDFTITSGETTESGITLLTAIFHDESDEPQRWRLPQHHIDALLKSCGGEDRAVGARMRFRLMPDDRLEFVVLVAAPEGLREAANDNDPEAEAA
jgi:hypothetical protein